MGRKEGFWIFSMTEPGIDPFDDDSARRDPNRGWFGESWGSPICALTSHRETPVGMVCLYCGVAIVEGDRGLILPYVGDLASAPDENGEALVNVTATAWHIECFALSAASDEIAPMEITPREMVDAVRRWREHGKKEGSE